MHLLHLFLFWHRQQQNAIRRAQRFNAAVPGRIAIDRATWKRCFPNRFLAAYVAIGGLFGIGFLCAYISGTPAGLWALAGSAFFSVFVLQDLIDAFALAKAQCERGCLVPARVLRADPFLIAVYSDLSQARDGPWPAVRIIKQPLERARGPRLRAATTSSRWPATSALPAKRNGTVSSRSQSSALPMTKTRLNRPSGVLRRPRFFVLGGAGALFTRRQALDRPGVHSLRKPEPWNWLGLLSKNRT